MVIDFRALNEKTIGDAYPLPNIEEILDQLGSAKYFSIFDLASGFHQIPMHEADTPKTAFSTPYGHYHFKRMPFGLKNALATFQRLMDQVLTGLQGVELFIYFNDIVIYASSLKEHEAKFNKLANRLRTARLRLQSDKCEFLRKEVTYLGHVITKDGLAEYEYEVIYKVGKINSNADALSRNPILPVRPQKHATPLNDDSDESLFSNINKDNSQEPSGSHADIPLSDKESTELDSDNDDHDETGSDDDSENEPLVDRVNTPFELKRRFLNETNERLSRRKDNLAIFVSQTGDKGALDLKENNRYSSMDELSIGKIKVIRDKKRYIIAMVIEQGRGTSSLIEMQALRTAIGSLVNATRELDLATLSICKSSIGTIEWKTIYRMLRDIFWNEETKITICNNLTSIPNNENRDEIIKECHASAMGGHKGITKTYNQLKTRYHWPGMKRDIQNVINNCRECHIKKLVRIKPRQPMILTDTPDRAFDKVSMDIMGPLPTTSAGNAYILTIQDLLTKYSIVVPLRNPAAIDIAEAFTNEFICIHGAPKALLTVQGTHFLNLMRNIARKFRIKHYKTAAYRPQSNGSIERSHEVLWEYLKQFVNKHSDWDCHLRLANFSYNTSVHEGTLFTPHELVMSGKTRVVHIDKLKRPGNRSPTADSPSDGTSRSKECAALVTDGPQTNQHVDNRYYRLHPLTSNGLRPHGI
ncbi:uncharacterized protein LOC105428340 [Pogonomyrmex barbatus]|uniref:RNA-directed DNA polymerase n=1 Tax=Pogonomyrmex barbatus TaxID=144034 RepID=A0A6I9WA99_9HYME|nr:uncharacterized protein LOC105428340 [Pogonomyrmex barbatus]